MKKTIFTIVITIIELLFVYGTIMLLANQTEKNIKCVYIDPGHGGFDGGTYVGSTIEKDITLNVSCYIASMLEGSGYKVHMTRNKDEALGTNKRDDMHKRVKMINESQANLYISIHVNSFPNKSVFGSQVFYNAKSENNKTFAQTIMKNIKIIDETNKRTEHEIKDKYLTDNVNITGCLIELGFLSNANDFKKLTSEEYLYDLSRVIYLGIVEYFDYLK